MKKFNTIGTHHGVFHADEVFAVAILRQIQPEAKVVRTRNSELLQECDIVVDVDGGKYDHHTNDKEFRDNGIPFASAGLIWRHFGPEIVDQDIVIALDEKLVQGIDALDNGYQLECSNELQTVSNLVSSFNPTWDSKEDENEAFEKAVAFATTVLENAIRSEASRQAAKSVVKEALENRTQKEVIVLGQFCPWTEHLLNLDTEEVQFVVFPDVRSGEHRIQVVPQEIGSFAARKSLPESWGGKRGEELGEEIGISDAVFCHPGRFIAGAVSFDSISKMAQIALGKTIA